MMTLAGGRAHVAQGEIRVETRSDVCLTTILGSCVAACIFDPIARTGGMNHFILPGDTQHQSGAAERYGVYLMEVLVNGLLEKGAERQRLLGKLFGGAKTTIGRGEIGAANAAFAKRFLAMENIPLVSVSLGGLRVRRVEFWPCSGRARQLYIDAPEPAPPPAPEPSALGQVEFF
ncbi:chemotaxis protein CheD [Aureimonas ureilytica]|uniref:Probable chemoreceptor glutamine deamidase CheD n=1 Tax=Aureimonas ureilytica TaxID=401562 RepID=A0A147DAY5_9HYPH|nr:chemotaxis protein CheD [Aureimonas ureilytica]KTR08107.1 chemotaxis protein CheD [Aureimonas ureilytica]